MQSSHALFRNPLVWIILVSISISGLLFTYIYFPKAFPIIQVDITMDRASALEKARTLAQHNAWGPEQYQQAASFDNDDQAQNYIELEGGGKEELKRILQEKYLSLYTWTVRHFKEGETNETLIYFTPEGNPYGFKETIAENSPGAALTAQQARITAETEATKQWHIDFSDYAFVESSQEQRPQGRIDHTFVYERIDKKVGEATYRLHIVISGDKLTELTLSLKVPEAFTRRYEQMRSANNTIAFTASLVMALLYGLVGCLGGLFYLMRKRYLIWKMPLIWGCIIAALQVGNTISQLPLSWMHYDTALAKSTFITTMIVTLILQFFASIALYTAIFMIAESLTRLAFKNHIQFWHVWSPDAARSLQVLGRTIGGYLMIGFDLALIVITYLLASRYLGWWNPSQALFNPNILGTYAPWLSSIAESSSAGFMEECLMRAIPLAGAALIGQRFGKRTLFIAIAFVLQAIIFGAAHANYPAQPAYARLVELIIPSFVFGGLYLAFGLLPGIISHYLWDVIWTALPLWVSSAPGIWISRLLVIIFAFMPLLIVLLARLRNGAWKDLAQQYYNRSWQPRHPDIVTPTQEHHQPSSPLLRRTPRTIFFVGIIGLLAWIIATPFKQNGISVPNKATALQTAHTALSENRITLSEPWKEFAFVDATMNEQHRFIWTKGGKELYKQLLGNYLTPATWLVRYAQFDGDVAELAEEYHLYVDDMLHRMSHQLPEARPGAQLSEEEARRIAHQVLQKTFALDPKSVGEVSAVSTKHPQRIDWVFTFSHGADYPLKEGEPRISVEIDGDQIADYYQHIFVPEEWLRNDRHTQTIILMLTLLCGLLLGAISMLGIINAVLSWIHHRFAVKTFLIITALLLVKSLVQTYNLWPIFISQFKTSEPFQHQLLVFLGTLLLQVFVKALATGLLVGYVQSLHMRHQVSDTTSNRFLLGTSLGVSMAGIMALLNRVGPSIKPLWADYVHSAAHYPALSFALTQFTDFLGSTVLYVLIFAGIDYMTKGGTFRIKYPKLGLSDPIYIVVLGLGIALYGTIGIKSISSWLLCGLILGIVLLALYKYALRFDKALIPFFSAALVSTKIIQEASFNAYPGVIMGAILAIIGIELFAWWWSKTIVSDHYTK